MVDNQTRTRALQAGRFAIIGCCSLLGLVLAACGSPDQAETAPPEAAAQAPQSAGPSASRNPLADMVKAVPTASGDKRVELRFEYPERPALGEPLDLNLNVLSLADASRIDLKVMPQAGVEVLAGGETSFGALKTGESVSHSLQLRASVAGISVIDVQLIATVDGKPDTAAFAIPVALVAVPEPAVATAGK